ncbi:MAG: hypothetical protein RLY58_2144 [Pseudomonadota bacterium]|jgi:acyl dehydratase
MSAVPLHLIRYQLPMIWGVMQAFVPILRPRHADPDCRTLTRDIAAPADALVNAYLAWSGAEPQRYVDHLPPHLVSQWGIPVVTALLLKTGYSLSGIINQGVSIQQHGRLPRHQPLRLTVHLESVEEDAGRIRLSAHVHTGTVEQPDLSITTLHMLLIEPHYKRRKGDAQPVVPQHWNTIGQWQAIASDGLDFALLTGDFNPIHWINAAAKRSPFRHLVLHGFGMFARSYERIPQVEQLRSIDVRFLRPVPLPSQPLSVQVAVPDANGLIPLRLIGAANKVHMVGTYQ